MPEVLKYDSDGDAIYAEPDGTEPLWNLEGDPYEMGMKAVCAAVARDILGCQIKWWGYYCDWVCGCRGLEHATDSQCSAITIPENLIASVLTMCHESGIDVKVTRSGAPTLKHSHAVDYLRAALVAWREE